MAKYNIFLNVHTAASVVIDAQSEEEAKCMAVDLVNEALNDSGVCFAADSFAVIDPYDFDILDD